MTHPNASTRSTAPQTRWVWPLTALLLLVLAGSVSAQSLQSRINKIVLARSMANTTCALYVMDLDDGSMMAAHNATQQMMPASNQKLLVTAAAVEILGPQFNFDTQFMQHGDDLLIVGSGDPSLGDSELLAGITPPMNVEQLLDRWVDGIKEKGIRKIDRIIVDDRIFDRQFVHPNWPDDQLINWYCAEVGGINFNDNCLDVYTSPSRNGLSPHVRTVPYDPPIDLKISARTDLSIRNDAPWFSREPQTNKITVHGKVKLRKTSPFYVTFHNPPMFFGELMAKRLRAAGVAVGSVQLAGPDDSFESAKPIATARMPLFQVMQRCNSDSQNLFAEALIKRIGRQATGEPGSWNNGAAAIRQHFAQLLGVETAQLVIDDGSGMSRYNRVTPRILVRILQHVHGKPDLWPTFRDSLSTGGESGTLRKRFDSRMYNDCVIYGKSGYIRGVVSLSGYIVFEHKTAAFSILLNDYTGSLYSGQKIIDSIVDQIHEELAKSKPVTSDNR